MEPPPLGLKHLLTKTISIAGRWSGVIAGAVGLDSQNHTTGLVRMRTGEVDAIAGDAILGRHRDAPFLKTVHDGELKRIEWFVTDDRAKVLATRGGIFEVLPQEFHTTG